jgi:regulator of replication initiation timing/antitoxin component of RelBE/YafQ-DinJ toxin-antitoxin module
VAKRLQGDSHETRRAAPLTIQVQNLEQQQAGFLERVGQLEQQRAQAAQQNAALQVENQRLHRDADEVVNLRGQLARLQADSQELAWLKALEQEREKDSDYLTAKLWLERADRFKAWVAAHPEQEIPEFQYLYEDSWLDVVKNNDLASDNALKDASRMLRDRARDTFGLRMSDALRRFVTEHNGELPTDLRQLNSYLTLPMPENLANAYKLLYSGRIADVPPGKWPIIEIRAPEYPGAGHIAVGTNVSTRL